MSEKEKSQVKTLALNMLHVPASSDDGRISSLLKTMYGISLDDFYNLVWDLMDYAPVMVRPDGTSAAHVLGGSIASDKGTAFLALVEKKYSTD